MPAHERVSSPSRPHVLSLGDRPLGVRRGATQRVLPPPTIGLGFTAHILGSSLGILLLIHLHAG